MTLEKHACGAGLRKLQAAEESQGDSKSHYLNGIRRESIPGTENTDPARKNCEKN